MASKRRTPPRKQPAKRRGRARPEPPRFQPVRALIRAGGALCVMLTLAAGAMLVGVARTLPDIDAIRPAERTGAITLLDREGRTITRRGSSATEIVRAGDLPETLVDAVLAVEDRRFYSHFGVDPRGTARAALANARAGHVVQGGSTITQQLAKNLFLTPERTLRRKLAEAMLAFELERRLSKDEILALYLNRVYFGAGAWGAEDAARRYFSKDADDLSLGEAALLAGLLKAPTRYSPSSDATRAAVRATIVLDLMHASGRITEAQRIAAASAPIRVSSGSSSPGAGWFADWAIAEARSLARLYAPGHSGDLVVRTTLHVNAQRAAELALDAGLADPQIARGASHGALVALDGQGGVAAMAGGVDYARSPYNRAVNARRQPGSAFKAFVYASAFEAGYGPEDVFEDRPVSYSGWSPENWEGEYEGEMTLERAFARSSNSIAVQLAERTGRGYAIQLARRLGIESPIENTHAATLGAYEVSPLELARAYTPFMNGGHKVEPHAVLSIAAPDGRALYERETVAGPKVIADGVNAEMDRIFAAAVSYGTGRAAAVEGRQVHGKTGTTNGFRDAWFAGWSEGLTATVWLGRDDNAATNRGSGGAGPAHVFSAFMADAPRLGASPPASPAPESERRDDPIARLLAEGAGGRPGAEPPAEPAAEADRDPIAELLDGIDR